MSKPLRVRGWISKCLKQFMKKRETFRSSRKKRWLGRHLNKVFAVHNWETIDGLHAVHFGENLNLPENTKRFKRWKDAEKFAIKKSIELGLTEYMVDTPDEPHVIKSVSEEEI